MTDRSDWTAPEWQAFVAGLPTREERAAALEEVPEEWRLRVKHHVQTVFSIKKYQKRKAAERV